MRSKKTLPQGSVVFGSRFASFTDAGEKSAGLILLPANPPLRLIAPTVLHAADAMAVKSPFSIAAVGTNWNEDAGVRRTLVRWYAAK